MMALTSINNNLPALKSLRGIKSVTEDLTGSLERLSSGLRINRASDDASGLAISENLRTQIKGINQAIDNSSIAINLSNTAEGALSETTSRLQRIRTLAVQAANTATNSPSALLTIQEEIQAAIDEINRIATDTQFGTLPLLDGSISNIAAIKGAASLGVSVSADPNNSTLSTGSHELVISRVSAGSVNLSSGSDGNNSGATGFASWTFETGTYGLRVSNVTQGSSRQVSNAGSITDGASTVAAGADLLIGKVMDDGLGNTVTLDLGDEITLNYTRGDGSNGSLTYTLGAGSTSDDIAAQLSAGIGAGYTVAYDAVAGQFSVTQDSTGQSALALSLSVDDISNGAGSDLTAANVVRAAGVNDTGFISIDGGPGMAVTAGQTVTLNGVPSSNSTQGAPEITFTLGANLSNGIDQLSVVAAEYSGSLDGGPSVFFQNGDEGVRFSNTEGEVARIDMAALIDLGGSTSRSFLISAVNNSLTFPVGANADQYLSISISDMRATNLGFVGVNGADGRARTVNNINVTTLSGANSALEVIDEAIAQVNSQRGSLGTFTNRLEATMANLGVASENLTAAESRIRDSDIAFETSRLTRDQILMEAGISVLSQANMIPQNVLSLLQK